MGAAREVAVKYRGDGSPRCADCNADPAPGRARCVDCAKAHRLYSARRRKELKAAGCVVCGARAKKGRTVCKTHMTYYVRRVAQRRKEAAS